MNAIKANRISSLPAKFFGFLNTIAQFISPQIYLLPAKLQELLHDSIADLTELIFKDVENIHRKQYIRLIQTIELDATEILINIRKLVRSINLESKKIQKAYGISIPQLLVLNYLKSSDNFQATHKDIKEFLSLNSSTVTGIINRLESKGLLARLPKKEDKRVTYVALTSNGEKLLKETPRSLHETLELKIKGLSDENLALLQQALSLLIDLLDIKDMDASPLFIVEDPSDHTDN